jgi:hypothetical protein
MKSRLRAITIATLIFAATLLPPASSRALSLHPGDTQMSEADRKHFLDGEFRIIKDTKEFPAPIVKILCGTVELRSCMANPGERFNATDVIGDLRIPGRRLLFAGVLGDKYFVYYEQGGIALFHQISFFTVSGTDSVTTLWRGHCYGPIVNIEQLRQRVTSDACLK